MSDTQSSALPTPDSGEGDVPLTPVARTESSLEEPDTGIGGDDKDVPGTPRPEEKPQTGGQVDIGVLMAKIQELEKQAEIDRENYKAIQSGPLGRGPPIMAMPTMSCWDRCFNEAYVNPHRRADNLKDGMPPQVDGPERIERVDGRKKVMMGMLESELEWMKMEDDSFSKLMAERTELEAESRQLARKLREAESRVKELELEAKAAADKTKPPAESEDVGEEEQPEPQEETATSTTINVPQEESTVTAPVFNKPSLNKVPWDRFIADRLGYRALQDRDISKIFAIDILEGDPVIAFSYHTTYGFKGRYSLLNKSATAAPKKKVFARGQGPLPERIRINSAHILKILQKIDSDKFSEGDGGLVMIRPYKALVYYDEQIRKAYQDLKKKLGRSADVSEQATAPQADDKDEDVAKAQPDSTPVEEDEDPLTSSEVALEQLGVLIQFMDNEIQGKFDYVRSEQCQRISFPDVWYLFRPGDEVIDQGRKQVFRVIGVTSSAHKVIPPWRNYNSATSKSDETPVIIHCVYVDFDGKLLGPVLRSVQIPRFEGDKVITSLPVYPLRFVEGRRADGPNAQTVRQWLIARGKMFTDVLSVKHMNYNGFTLDTRDEVDGQVMVDFEESFANEEKEATNDRRKNKWRPSVLSLIGAELHETEDVDCSAGCCTGERVLKDSYAEKKRNEDYINSLIPEEPGREPSVAIYPRLLRDLKSSGDTLSDEELIVMSYRVFGFILRSRKWAKFDLSYLEYVQNSLHSSKDEQEGHKRRETAFDQLVMEQNQKNVILSLIAQHFRDKESATAATEQVDIVRGKGKGLIILLHGAPGVGKTTTAEGVAELFARPLFQITCGDLGTTAESVEASLETHFSLANRWGCILLLDEADVFLAKRTPQDFKRNGLVSVFLRVLEYYAGILFLTTNRIGDFDEAFGSRIHISLHYPQLTMKATREIFELNLRLIKQRFVEKKRTLELEEDLILQSAEKYWNKYKKMRWNGRQIRNACQTALALAEFDAQGGNHMEIMDANAVVKLSVKHLETVSAAYLEFMRYLEKLYKTDQDRLAHRRGYRARELDGKKGGKGADPLDATSSDDSEDIGDETCPAPSNDRANSLEPSTDPLTAPLSSSRSSISLVPGTAAQPNGAMPGLQDQGQGMMGNPAFPYMFPNMGYPQGYPPQSFQPAGQAMGGVPNAQQAQMWQNLQNIPPAVLQQMLQAQAQMQQGGNLQQPGNTGKPQ